MTAHHCHRAIVHRQAMEDMLAMLRTSVMQARKADLQKLHNCQKIKLEYIDDKGHPRWSLLCGLRGKAKKGMATADIQLGRCSCATKSCCMAVTISMFGLVQKRTLAACPQNDS